MQFAGVDPSPPRVIDIPRQCMELLDLEKPAPDACAEPRLGQVAEQAFGLEDAAQCPILSDGIFGMNSRAMNRMRAGGSGVC
jgi:hypothetical protein